MLNTPQLCSSVNWGNLLLRQGSTQPHLRAVCLHYTYHSYMADCQFACVILHTIFLLFPELYYSQTLLYIYSTPSSVHQPVGIAKYLYNCRVQHPPSLYSWCQYRQSNALLKLKVIISTAYGNKLSLCK